MPCCGQKRALQRAESARARKSPSPNLAPTQAAPPLEDDRAALRYLGNQTISLRGPQTGRVYYFAAASSPTAVYESDIEALLRTGLFERA